MPFLRGLCLPLFICSTILSCKKDQVKPPVQPPGEAGRHVLLKDIVIPTQAAPYYHFEYNTDSLVTKVNFASNLTMYDVFYSGDRIAEMRDNILVDHDTLRYVYNAAGKLSEIDFINEANVIYRHAFFTCDGQLVTKVSWDRRQQDGSFFTDRILTFTYHPDGNVKTITEHRPPPEANVEDYISVRTLEQYDDKVNVDDFTFLHDGIHDHLLLLQGFRLQKNNPTKETLKVNGADFYTVDYSYTYNADATPANKTGDFRYLSGQYAGKRFTTNTFYTYY
jgi:YD repeat-containing protein